MTMSVTYTTFAGMIVHENRGGEERFYSPDTLGSTQALYDETGTVTDTFEYWPYGEIRSRTGTTPTPFTFVGVLGYFMDTPARLYVRARHYLTQQGRWLTVDPLWPWEPAYGYVASMPHDAIDPIGLNLRRVSFPRTGSWPGRSLFPPKNPVLRPIKISPVGGAVYGAIGGALIGCVYEAYRTGGVMQSQDYKQYRDWCINCCKDILSGIGAGVIGAIVGSGSFGIGFFLGGIAGGLLGRALGDKVCPGLCDRLIPPPPPPPPCDFPIP